MKTTLYCTLAMLLCCQVINAQIITFQLATGGANSESAYGIVETGTGNLMIAGWSTTFFSGNENGVMMEVTPQATIQWTEYFGNNATLEQLEGLSSDGYGGYVAAGISDDQSSGRGYVVRYGANGNMIWTKSYGYGFLDWFSDVEPTPDGNIMVGSGLNFDNGIDMVVFKIDTSGNIIWNSRVGSSLAEMSLGSDLVPTLDGGVLLIGNTDQPGGADNLIAVKLDSTGAVEWTKISSLGGQEIAFGGTEIPGGFVLCGQMSNGAFLLQLDTAGNEVWAKSYGGGNRFNRILSETNGDLLVLGSSGNNGGDFLLMRVDSAGDFIWGMNYGGSGSDRPYNFIKMSGGGYAMAGETTSFGNGSEMYIIKTDDQGVSGCNETNFTVTPITTTLSIIDGVASAVQTGSVINHTHNPTTVTPTSTILCTSCSYDAIITMDTSLICSGDSIFVFNTSQNPDTTIWNVNGNYAGSQTPLIYHVDTAGVYNIQLVTGQGQCTDTLDTTITVNQTPTADFISSVTNGYTVSFTDQSLGNIANWSWDLGDTTTSSVQNPIHIYGYELDYTVCLTVVDSNGCTHDTCFNTGQLIGMGELAGNGSFRLYPTPASEYITIERVGGNNGNVLVAIYNISGQLIRSSAIPASGRIDIRDLSQGSYFLQIQDDRATGRFRLVKL